MLDRPEITIVEHPDAISSLGGETESFDIIICTRRLESIGPASTLFARSRTLLRPLGLFLVGGSNWNALERRWRPKAWLAGHAEATQYGSLGHLRSYATRFGFEIVNAGTTPRLEEISAALYGGDHPAARLAATPFGLAGALPGLGSIFWGLLAKRGLAPSRVTHAEATDEALAPGLATLQIYHRENPPFDNRKSSFETD